VAPIEIQKLHLVNDTELLNPCKERNILNKWATMGFSRATVFHEAIDWW